MTQLTPPEEAQRAQLLELIELSHEMRTHIAFAAADDDAAEGEA